MRYEPMLCKESKVYKHGPEWLVERKWDGMRALFELDPVEGTRIFSRTGQDLREQFPELLDLHERVGVSCVLDGEIVSLDDEGVEDLERLQMRLGDKLARRRMEFPVHVVFFDVLETMGHAVLSQPLFARRNLLSAILDGSGLEMSETLENGDPVPAHWEGVVSKLRHSTYQCGKRRSIWIKWKFTHRATLQVSGLTEGKGARASSFGACEVVDANGVPRGQVGSGFTQEALLEIMEKFYSDIPIFIEVEYRFLSKTGLMVNTAFKGIRYDKTEADNL